MFLSDGKENGYISVGNAFLKKKKAHDNVW